MEFFLTQFLTSGIYTILEILFNARWYQAGTVAKIEYFQNENFTARVISLFLSLGSVD